MSASAWRRETGALARRLSRAFGEIQRRLRDGGDALERPPGPRAWSALEIAEHVALTNHHLLLLVRKIAARARAKIARGEEPPSEPSRLDHLEGLAARDFAWTSPEHMLPAGQATPREIAGTLLEQRRRSLALLASMRDGEGSLHAISMSVVGERLDLYQYLALIALHMERHADQMDRAISGGTGSA